MAAEMRAKLEANRHKLHWRSPRVQTEYLALRLYEEVAELLAAVRSGVRADAWAEAADVANFAAMLADRTREDGLLPPLDVDAPRGTVLFGAFQRAVASAADFEEAVNEAHALAEGEQCGASLPASLCAANAAEAER